MISSHKGGVLGGLVAFGVVCKLLVPWCLTLELKHHAQLCTKRWSAKHQGLQTTDEKTKARIRINIFD